MGRKMKTSQGSKFGLDIRKNFLKSDGNGLYGHLELLSLGGRRLIEVCSLLGREFVEGFGWRCLLRVSEIIC